LQLCLVSASVSRIKWSSIALEVALLEDSTSLLIACRHVWRPLKIVSAGTALLPVQGAVPVLQSQPDAEIAMEAEPGTEVLYEEGLCRFLDVTAMLQAVALVGCLKELDLVQAGVRLSGRRCAL